MRKIPISGGPHSGKTTLFEALKLEFPDAYFVAEPAEAVISRELARKAAANAAGLSYDPIVPWIDYTKFALVVVNKSESLEATIPRDADIVFQDRSLIDNIGYARLNGFDSFIPTIQQKAHMARYVLSFFCEPVGTYTMTDIRRETPEQARTTHDYLARAYDEFDVPVVHLPAVSVAERIEIIRHEINNVQ